MGLPAGTEFLDPIVPQYLAGLISWTAIGARTTESQTHREMASGLSMPVGFKNGTSGDSDIAIAAMISARSEHAFLGIDGAGKICVVHTAGNPDGHVVLRGGADGPNYDEASVRDVQRRLAAAGLAERLLVDCSHANSNKDHQMQPVAFRDAIAQRAAGNEGIVGLMLESHLFPGSQKLGADPSTLQYGVSITDACIGWEDTETLLLGGRRAVARRRNGRRKRLWGAPRAEHPPVLVDVAGIVRDPGDDRPSVRTSTYVHHPGVPVQRRG